MIVILLLVGLVGVGFRLWRRQLSRIELSLLAFAFLAAGGVVAQSWVSGHVLPEKRYWIQITVLLLPWTVWLCRQVRHARKLLILIVFCMAANDCGLLIRGHIPGSNKNSRVGAIDWAAAIVKSDYKGPAQDVRGYLGVKEYHRPNRPVIASPAQLKRLAYAVNGRPAHQRFFGDVDKPDYVFGEAGELTVSTSGYVRLAERTFHGRTFELWRIASSSEGKAP